MNVLMCPHTCVTNLPKPREVHSDVGPASVIVGNLVQGNRLAAAAGRDIGGLEDETGDVGGGGKKYQFIAEILRWRAQVTSSTHSFHNLIFMPTILRQLPTTTYSPFSTIEELAARV